MVHRKSEKRPNAKRILQIFKEKGFKSKLKYMWRNLSSLGIKTAFPVEKETKRFERKKIGTCILCDEDICQDDLDVGQAIIGGDLQAKVKKLYHTSCVVRNVNLGLERAQCFICKKVLGQEEIDEGKAWVQFTSDGIRYFHIKCVKEKFDIINCFACKGIMDHHESVVIREMYNGDFVFYHLGCFEKEGLVVRKYPPDSPKVYLIGSPLFAWESLVKDGKGKMIRRREKKSWLAILENTHRAVYLIRGPTYDDIPEMKRLERAIQLAERKKFTKNVIHFDQHYIWKAKGEDVLHYTILYSPGQTLKKYIIEKREAGIAFTWKEIAELLLQICYSLIPLHKSNLVYRRLMPESLLVCEDKKIRLMDFSLMKETVGLSDTYLIDMRSTRQKIEGLGAIRYISPEQLRFAKHVGSASDVWSIGVIGFELATDHQSLFDTMKELQNFYKLKPRGYIVGMKKIEQSYAPLLEILEKCFAKSHERYHNAQDLANALKKLLGI